MIDYNRITDIEYLKSFGTEPKFFGLGFVQWKLTDTHRVHFWHPRISSVVAEEELHDHRYDFKSTVVIGNVRHEVWKFVPNPKGRFVQSHVSCSPNYKVPDDAVDVDGDAMLSHEYEFSAGSSYTVRTEDFHRIKTDFAMTLVERGPIQKDFALVIREKQADVVCPFNDQRVLQINTADCYEIIDEVINGIPHGYHRTNIQKGVVGEASKIIEEVLELQDAIKQDNKIMALCELSDMIAATKAYLERHHGGKITLNDLEVMGDATVRAFRDGTRS